MSMSGSGGAMNLSSAVPNLYSGAAGAAAGATNPYMGQAASMYGRAAQPISSGQIGNYMNPYTNDVVNRSLGDIQRMVDINLNNVQGDMAANNAFGARGDLLKNEVIRSGLDTAGRTAAGLRSQGFDTALNAAGGDMSRMLSAAGGLGGLGSNYFSQMLGQSGALSGLANQGFDFYRMLNSDLNQMGTQERDIMQQLINASIGGFGQLQQYPMQAMGMLTGGTPNIEPGKSISSTPGLLDIISSGLKIYSGL